MAEFVMKHLVKQSSLEGSFLIDSKATSTEEIGNTMHQGTIKKLREQNIPFTAHRASQMKKEDYEKYNFIIAMDSFNYRNILRITGPDTQQKISLLMDFTPHPKDIADPWYTGNFDETFSDIFSGCTSLLEKLRKTL